MRSAFTVLKDILRGILCVSAKAAGLCKIHHIMFFMYPISLLRP